MSGDPRLARRGVTRAQVVADLRRVVAHCDGVPAAAEALELGKSMIYATLVDNRATRIGEVVLLALYGPEGGDLPEAWREDGTVIGADDQAMLTVQPVADAEISMATASLDGMPLARAIAEVAGFADDAAEAAPPLVAPVWIGGTPSDCNCGTDGASVETAADWRAPAISALTRQVAAIEADTAARLAPIRTALRAIEDCPA